MTRARGRQAGRPMRFEEVSERRPRRTCMRAAAAAIVGLTDANMSPLAWPRGSRWGRGSHDGLTEAVWGRRPKSALPASRGSARPSPRSCILREARVITSCMITVRAWRSRRLSPSAPFRNGHGAGARISGGAPWPSVSGARPCGGPAHRDRTSPPQAHWPDSRIGRPADRPVETTGVRTRFGVRRTDATERTGPILGDIHPTRERAIYGDPNGIIPLPLPSLQSSNSATKR